MEGIAEKRGSRHPVYIRLKLLAVSDILHTFPGMTRRLHRTICHISFDAGCYLQHFLFCTWQKSGDGQYNTSRSADVIRCIPCHSFSVFCSIFRNKFVNVEKQIDRIPKESFYEIFHRFHLSEMRSLLLLSIKLYEFFFMSEFLPVFLKNLLTKTAVSSIIILKIKQTILKDAGCADDGWHISEQGAEIIREDAS